jgi:hypothetical protein
VTVLLGHETVELYRPGPHDAHGWRQPGPATLAWTGPGSLQALQGADAISADASGGHGPSEPREAPAANLYLPPAAGPVAGMSARVRGEWWNLAAVRYIADPRGTGDLDCWLASCTAGGP